MPDPVVRLHSKGGREFDEPHPAGSNRARNAGYSPSC